MATSKLNGSAMLLGRLQNPAAAVRISATVLINFESACSTPIAVAVAESARKTAG